MNLIDKDSLKLDNIASKVIDAFKQSENTGVALGGGAVLGVAHIGILRALEEADIEIKYLSGTSIGAFVAAFYAFGIPLDEIESIAKELEWMDITDISLSKFALLSNAKIGELISAHIGNKNIEDAKIKLGIVSTNVASGEKVVFTKGSICDAVMASTCIPGIFHPIEIEGQLYVDGGIVENVPAATVKNMGADFVIGVDLNAHHQYGKPENILDVILNSFHYLMKQNAKIQSSNSDIMICPNLSGFNRSDMSQTEALVKKGYEDALPKLKEIK